MFKKCAKNMAAITCAIAVSTPVSANDDLIGGLIGGMIGAAISNQANATKSKSSRRSGSGISAEVRAKNKEIQEALNYFGFNAGTPDGVLGRKTRDAVSQLQACINAPIVGKLNSFEEQFLKSSHYKAQAGGNATLSIVAMKPNGYCGLLQQYYLELTTQSQTVTVQQAGQNTSSPVVSSQTNSSNGATAYSQPANVSTQSTSVTYNETNNTTVVVIDAELQQKYDQLITQLKLLEQIKAYVDAKASDESGRRKLATISERLNELSKLVGSIETQAKGEYGTPIKPSNANLGVTAVKASEVFPRVPYYIPGTDETGELWVKPYVTDDGHLMYDFNFVAKHSSFSRIKDTIELTSDDVRAISNALIKVTEWSDLAIKKGMRRRYQKSAICFPTEMCGDAVAGKNSTEVIFMLYEDGSTAARLQENKGKFRSGYNVSIESGLLLSAYMDYMADIGEKEFEANTMTDDDLDDIFKD